MTFRRNHPGRDDARGVSSAHAWWRRQTARCRVLLYRPDWQQFDVIRESWADPARKRRLV